MKFVHSKGKRNDGGHAKSDSLLTGVGRAGCRYDQVTKEIFTS
jgi:hypothetical protein